MADSSVPPHFFNFLREKPTLEKGEGSTTRIKRKQKATEEEQRKLKAPADPAPRGRKRTLAGTPRIDEEEEVVALTPEQLLATHRFECPICEKGFQRDQNLQLHLRGHSESWTLKTRDPNARRKRYVCPEPTCVHHDPVRALGDLTGIKKHYSRKHCEKRYPCTTCDRGYAVMGDLKAHTKICASHAKQDSLITHRSLCDAFLENTIHAPTSNTSNASLKFTIPTPPLNSSTFIRSSDALIESALPRFAQNTNANEFFNSTMLASSDAFTNKAKPSPSIKASTFLSTGDTIIDSEVLAPSTNTPAFLNTNSDALLHRTINASSMNISNGFPGSSIHAPTLNTYDAFLKSAIHAPSLNVTSLSSMPSLSLSVMPVPSSNVASMNLYASLNDHVSLRSFENHLFDGSKSHQLETDDSYSNCDLIRLFSLSEDHPMLKDPISSEMHPPHSTMPSSSTYNFVQTSDVDCRKNKNKKALA